MKVVRNDPCPCGSGKKYKQCDHDCVDSLSADQGGHDARECYTQNLFDISAEFLGYLHREEGVPYTKGELARQQIRQYLQQRQDGKLEWRESPLEAAMRRGNHARQKQRRSPPTPPDHPLCPNPGTLDRYLGGLMNAFFPQRYKAATLIDDSDLGVDVPRSPLE